MVVTTEITTAISTVKMAKTALITTTKTTPITATMLTMQTTATTTATTATTVTQTTTTATMKPIAKTTITTTATTTTETTATTKTTTTAQTATTPTTATTAATTHTCQKKALLTTKMLYIMTKTTAPTKTNRNITNNGNSTDTNNNNNIIITDKYNNNNKILVEHQNHNTSPMSPVTNIPTHHSHYCIPQDWLYPHFANETASKCTGIQPLTCSTMESTHHLLTLTTKLTGVPVAGTLPPTSVPITWTVDTNYYTYCTNSRFP